MNRLVSIGVGAAILCQADAAAQPEWRQTASPFTPVSHHAMVYDEARDRVVLFGGWITDYDGSLAASVVRTNRLWGWTGQQWESLSQSGPSARSSAAITYDPSQESVLIFGGTTNGTNNLRDLWAWDGEEWSVLESEGPFLDGPVAMAYDQARSETVLVGEGESETCETWVWDGASWSQRLVTGPPNRERHAMVYDPGSQRVVLVGGQIEPNTPDESGSWAWDGTSWAELGLDEPLIPSEHTLAYDEALGGVIMLVNYSSQDTMKLLRLTGATWEEIESSTPIGPREWSSMAVDQATESIIMTGGTVREPSPLGGSLNINTGQSFVFSDGEWELVSAYTWKDTTSSTMAYDRDRETVILFGDRSLQGPEYNNEATALRENGIWRIDTTLTPDPNRSSHGMVFDQARGETLMLGGSNSLGYSTQLRNTWAWTGTGWEHRAVDGPAPRAGFGLANDAARSEVVLFGGSVFVGESDNGGPFSTASDETWIWDGSAWTQRLVEGPLKTSGVSMVYDPVHGETVMFGGRAYDPSIEPPEDRSYYSQETWCWDGNDWDRRTVGGPPPRRSPHMVFDTAKQCVLMYGGQDENYDALTDLWSWDGTSWREIMIAPGPELPSRQMAAVYDVAREELVLACSTFRTGTGYSQPYTQIWSLPSRCSAADLNADNFIDFGDIGAFVDLFLAGDLVADINGDGIIDLGDIQAFVAAFLEGC